MEKIQNKKYNKNMNRSFALLLVAGASASALAFCYNMGESSTDDTAVCTTCTTGAPKADGTACNARIYGADVTFTCKDGVNPGWVIPPDGSGGVDVYYQEATGTCQGGKCAGAAGPVKGPVTMPFTSEFPCYFGIVLGSGLKL